MLIAKYDSDIPIQLTQCPALICDPIFFLRRPAREGLVKTRPSIDSSYGIKLLADVEPIHTLAGIAIGRAVPEQAKAATCCRSQRGGDASKDVSAVAAGAAHSKCAHSRQVNIA